MALDGHVCFHAFLLLFFFRVEEVKAKKEEARGEGIRRGI